MIYPPSLHIRNLNENNVNSRRTKQRCLRKSFQPSRPSNSRKSSTQVQLNQARKSKFLISNDLGGNVSREYLQFAMRKIVDTLEKLYTKILYLARHKTICVFQRRLIGICLKSEREISVTFMASSLIVNLKVGISILPLKVSEMQYDLYMRVDSNTNGHRQWFYFSMKNEKKCKVRLHIYRFRKVYSLFQRGMKPYVRSRKSGEGWRPGGQQVIYHYQRQVNEYGTKKESKHCVLTFTFQFVHQNDEVFIAAGIPYSYTYLNKQLASFKSDIDKRQNLNFELTTLCRSMCGLDVPLLTVYHRMANLVHHESKQKFIIINTRTHSGQTSCSWVLDGFLMELCQSQAIQEWLLKENICLKIVPMLNPDGVFIGNYRTGIVGDDFNRRFNSGRKEFYPQIYGLKKLVSTCKKTGHLQLFLDLHGHSILKNSFIYGPSQSDFSHFKMRNISYHLFHNSKYFRLASCKFKSENANIQTARVYFQLKEEILSLTCQNSLGLFYHQNQTFQMLIGDWHNFGASILHSMKDIYVNQDITIPKTQAIKKPTIQVEKSTKVSLVKQIQKKIGMESEKAKYQTSKANKNEKIHFKIPQSTSVKYGKQEESRSRQKSLITANFSHQIEREDKQIDIQKQTLDIRLKQRDKAFENSKVAFKIRRKSEIMKIPATSIVQRIINKQKMELKRNDSEQEEKPQFYFARSSTYDHSESLQRQIGKLEKAEEEEVQTSNLYPSYDMEPIKQNFSEDYCSINDSDSSGDDLPAHERNYIFQYIKSNQKQHFQEEQEEKQEEVKEIRCKSKGAKEPKISRFREIRFKSIEESYCQEGETRDLAKNTIKKIKLQVHKFKDNNSRSLISKYNEIMANSEFDDPTMVAISQQKRLNERIKQYHRTQKDPFVLIQRKEKFQREDSQS